MCLWIGDAPVCIYDFAKSELADADIPWGNGVSREHAEVEGKAKFAEKVSGMFATHGGVAQERRTAGRGHGPNQGGAVELSQ
jgi:hypothetical protein